MKKIHVLHFLTEIEKFVHTEDDDEEEEISDQQDKDFVPLK